MYRVDLYARVRRACRVERMSVHEASRVFGVDRKTVRKMLSFSVPPGYRRSAPPRRPKLGPFTRPLCDIQGRLKTSQGPNRRRANVHGFSDTAGLADILPKRRLRYCLRPI